MKLSTISISRASRTALLAECKRLELDVPASARDSRLRQALRKYRSDYQFWRQWVELGRRLCNNTSAATLKDALEVVYDHLWVRLAQEGYVASNGGDRSIYDPAHDRLVFVLERETTIQARVDIGERRDSYSVLRLAELAFTDVELTLSTWEAWKTGNTEP